MCSAKERRKNNSTREQSTYSHWNRNPTFDEGKKVRFCYIILAFKRNFSSVIVSYQSLNANTYSKPFPTRSCSHSDLTFLFRFVLVGSTVSFFFYPHSSNAVNGTRSISLALFLLPFFYCVTLRQSAATNENEKHALGRIQKGAIHTYSISAFRAMKTTKAKKLWRKKKRKKN